MRLAAITALLVAALASGTFLLSRADGPVWVFAGDRIACELEPAIPCVWIVAILRERLT